MGLSVKEEYDLCHSRYLYDENTGELLVKTWYSGIAKSDVGKPVGKDNGTGYLQIRLNRKFVYVHRVIWLMKTGKWPEHQIDHINRIRKDNRWLNLREVTHRENNFNRVDSLEELYISKVPSGNFRLRMPVDGKTKHIGTYKTLEEAKRVRDSLYDSRQ